MSRRPKHYFAAVPARALADQRLRDGNLFYLLAAIALHDRMSASTRGQGCWVGDRRLAADIGCDERTVRRLVPKLCGWGYVVQDRLATDKRKRVLRVLYTDADEALANGEIQDTKVSGIDAEMADTKPSSIDEKIPDTSEKIPDTSTFERAEIADDFAPLGDSYGV